jgi:hypothetical protein
MGDHTDAPAVAQGEVLAYADPRQRSDLYVHATTVTRRMRRLSGVVPAAGTVFSPRVCAARVSGS